MIGQLKSNTKCDLLAKANLLKTPLTDKLLLLPSMLFTKNGFNELYIC